MRVKIGEIISQNIRRARGFKYLLIFGQPFGVGTEGTVPFNLLPSSHIFSRLVLSPKDGGIVPLKALFDKYKNFNDGRLKKLEGIVPFRALLDMRTSIKEDET